jgi:hypothetical protein
MELPMIDSATYMLELPWLDYDRAAICELCPEHSDRWFHMLSPRGNTEKFWRYPTADGLADHPLVTHVVQQVRSRLPADFGEIHVGFTKFEPNFDLAPHLDYKREASIMMPLLMDDLAPIRWVDDQGHTLYTHEYRMPTLIRTQIKHGVLNRSATRIVFELGMFRPWDEIVFYMSKSSELDHSAQGNEP